MFVGARTPFIGSSFVPHICISDFGKTCSSLFHLRRLFIVQLVVLASWPTWISPLLSDWFGQTLRLIDCFPLFVDSRLIVVSAFCGILLVASFEEADWNVSVEVSNTLDCVVQAASFQEVQIFQFGCVNSLLASIYRKTLSTTVFGFEWHHSTCLVNLTRSFCLPHFLCLFLFVLATLGINLFVCFSF